MAKIQVHYAISASHDLMSTVRPIKLCNWKTTVRIKFLQRTLYLKKQLCSLRVRCFSFICFVIFFITKIHLIHTRLLKCYLPKFIVLCTV